VTDEQLVRLILAILAAQGLDLPEIVSIAKRVMQADVSALLP